MISVSLSVCSPGTVPGREISEMKARLFLNLGLVCDHLGEPKRCSEFIRRSVFIAEYEHPFVTLNLILNTQVGRGRVVSDFMIDPL